MSTVAESTNSGNILDVLYPVPIEGPADERYFHEDLKAMSPAVLRCELERVRLRLTVDPRPHQWLLDRLAMIEEEMVNHAH